MGAKVHCKKGYNAKDGCVEFKKSGQNEEACPVSDVACCEKCNAKVFAWEEA